MTVGSGAIWSVLPLVRERRPKSAEAWDAMASQGEMMECGADQRGEPDQATLSATFAA